MTTPDRFFLGVPTPDTIPDRVFWEEGPPVTVPDRVFDGGYLTGDRTGPGFETGSLLFKKNWDNRPNFFFVLKVSQSTLDMYYKQPKKEEHDYHFDTVNVMSPESKKNTHLVTLLLLLLPQLFTCLLSLEPIVCPVSRSKT